MLVFGLVLLCLSSVIATTLDRHPVKDTNARCLDGSPYFYYISVGTQSKNFYINHQGGGWCQDINECIGRSKGGLGSSKSWGPSQGFGNDMDRNPAVNPTMHDWTFVYLPYCDGGSFTGDATFQTPQELLYFQGLKIREAVVESLKSDFGFSDAESLVVGGCSAGGLAAYLHVDWWAGHVPKARARGMIDSGFFLDGNYTRDGKPDYEGRMKNLYEFMNSKVSIIPECNTKLGYKCLFAYHILPFIKTPILALNSAYDATMGNGECGHSGIIFNWADPKSVNDCGNYIRSLFKQLLAPPKSAVFLDSCKHHCGEWNNIVIDSQTSSSAFQLFWTKGDEGLPNGGYMDQDKVYPCDACCHRK